MNTGMLVAATIIVVAFAVLSYRRGYAAGVAATEEHAFLNGWDACVQATKSEANESFEHIFSEVQERERTAYSAGCKDTTRTAGYALMIAEHIDRERN